MARAREMQGVPAHVTTLVSDGKRRHPANCTFAQGTGKNRKCANPVCVLYQKHCKTAARCDFYQER